MKQIKYIAVGVAVIAVFIGVSWFLLDPSGVDVPAVEDIEEPSVEEQFEDLLNGLLKQTAEKAQEYKARRKVMTELVKPENLSTEEYVAENYHMMQKLQEELPDKMDEMMLQFAQTDEAIKILLRDNPADKNALILKEWKQVRQQQAGDYMRFFETDRPVLRAYGELMNLYYDIQGRFTVDLETDEMIFENPQDELHVKAKLREIKTLVRAQALTLEGGEQSVE